MLRTLLAAIAVLTVLASAPVSTQAQPRVAFEEAAILVSGVPPGGAVALLGVVRGVRGTIPYLDRFDEILVDEDGDGQVRFEPRDGVEPLSPWGLWAAVDLTSGDVGAGFVDPEEQVAWVTRPVLAAGAAEVEEARRYLEVVLVRPGPAPRVWKGRFGDGTGADRDGLRDKKLRIAFADLEPMAEAPAAPARPAAGDVVVAVDPQTLEIWTRKLGR